MNCDSRAWRTSGPWPYLSHAISVVVGDVDAHHQRVQAESATILTGPRDQRMAIVVETLVRRATRDEADRFDASIEAAMAEMGGPPDEFMVHLA